MAYRIEEAQKKKEQLSEIRQQLRLESNSLRNISRIDSIARRELGMVVPVPGQMVMLRADSPFTIPTPQTSRPAEQVAPQQAVVPPQPTALTAKR